MELFTNHELEVVDNSFDKDALPARFRNIILGAFVAIAVAATMVVLGATVVTLAIAMAIYVAIATLEKVSYVKTAMTSRATIRKLVRRIEKLEGVPLTPDNAEPSRQLLNQDSEAA